MAREGMDIQTGVRDVAALNEMGFPVWSTGICAQGTVKATAGSVDVPIFIGGDVVRPGDAIVADDDGVLRVDRGEVPAALDASRARAAKEEQTRAALAGDHLCLDRYEMSPLLGRLGVRYVPYGEWSGDE
jgi:4-hydroxy-4-methyl-2-oxoglutarate aldolase